MNIEELFNSLLNNPNEETNCNANIPLVELTNEALMKEFKDYVNFRAEIKVTWVDVPHRMCHMLERYQRELDLTVARRFGLSHPEL